MERQTQTFKKPLYPFNIQGNMQIFQKKVKICNSLHVGGHLIAPYTYLIVDGDLTVSGTIVCDALHVKGNINCSSLVCLEGSVVIDKTINCQSIYSCGDIIVEEYIDCETCYAGGVIDCLDIDSNGHPIESEELICRTLD